jgi:hypothetical protein
VLETTGDTHVAPDERSPGERFQGVAGAQQRREDRGGINRVVDQRGTNPDAGPEAAAEQERGGKRNSGRRPDGGGMTGRNGELQRQLGRHEIDNGQQADPPKMRHPLDRAG